MIYLLILFILQINALQWCEEYNAIENKITIKCYEESELNIPKECNQIHFNIDKSNVNEIRIVLRENISKNDILIDCEKSVDTFCISFG